MINIWKIKEGTWEYRVYLTEPNRGKCKVFVKRGFLTKEEAYSAACEARLQILKRMQSLL